MKTVSIRQAKVTDDNGVTRSKVPAPILKALGAKAGDYLTFEMGEAGCVMMRVLKKRTRKVKKIKK
jgi:bifunctional DNA-binding transcriptional regulator/antitoxin component of YhaV-PrlF toxin-antitoxin module